MICIESQYFNINRILLLALGVWPYRRTLLARLQFIFLFGILVGSVIFQLTALTSSRCTMDLVVKVLSTSLVFTCYGIKYNSFNVNAETVKSLLERVQSFCNELKDKHELAIIERYGNLSKYYTIGLLIMVACCMCIFVIAQTWPEILQIAPPINESQLHYMTITTEYFVDQDKYFYLILFHTNAAVCVGIISWVATGTMLMAYIQYTCGMFSISSYRIQHAMLIHGIQNINLRNRMINDRIICAVNIHRKAMEYSEGLISKFEMPFFCMIVVGVVALSFNLIRIVMSNSIDEILLSVIFMVSCILYMFFANYMGQNVMDHNKHIFSTAYNIQWYIAPVYIQRLILFMLQRGTKDFTLNVRGLFIGSLQCFATMINASLSYFTVMYSIR